MIKENTYFDGGVKSLAFNQSGTDVSVGVMAAGEYTFGTGSSGKNDRCKRRSDCKACW